MQAEARYRRELVRGWRLVHRVGGWNHDARNRVLEIVESQPRSVHPQTLAIRLNTDDSEQEAFLKVFHSAGGGRIWKDALRRSKALSAWRIGLQLESAGFSVPVTIAAGEERRAGILRRAFLVTEKIEGEPAHRFLAARLGGAGTWPLAAKRSALRQAAALLRRFHRAGFVHGDLVATNLFVSTRGEDLTIYFMDNDRTRRYPAWLPQPLWKRNLIQLNRMPLAGVTLQDRVRFFKAYRNIGKVARADRALARWLERATRRRRAECDGVDGSGDFRRLMRWTIDAAPSARTDGSG